MIYKVKMSATSKLQYIKLYTDDSSGKLSPVDIIANKIISISFSTEKEFTDYLNKCAYSWRDVGDEALLIIQLELKKMEQSASKNNTTSECGVLQ